MNPMKTRPFKQVDVFTAKPYAGNALAVVLDGTDLDTDEMQKFAKWTNLSETTFLLPPTEPTADYHVRIFTPGGELPFAGHPTLGSCHAWLQAGGKPKSTYIVQQCAAGLIPIQRDGERLTFAAPPVKRSAPSPSLLAKVAGALGLKAQQIVAAQLLDNGPVWLGLLLKDADTVLALKPDHRMLKELGQKVGVAGIPAQDDEGAPPLIVRSNREARAFARSAEAPVALEVRAFAAPLGVEEDPVTGSLNASLAQWLIAEGHLPERYLAAQGQCMGRAGRVHVNRDADGQVWVGGDSVTCIDGSVTL
jgi:PhzF family phenazine biosynthesis protein